MVVYLGKALTPNDVFARLVDSGQQIPSVDGAVESINEYFALLHEFQIGNVVSISEVDSEPRRFKFVKLANSPSGIKPAEH